MKPEERRAEQYLKSLNLGSVVFEPHGNIAPDFEVGNSIAVEVRRLNQNYEHGGTIRALEEDQIPLAAKMKNLVHGFRTSPDRDGEAHSWFVCYTIRRRPIDPWRRLEPELKKFLEFSTGVTDL